MTDFSKVLIRCSNINLIMGDSKALISDKQSAEIDRLLMKEKLTPTQDKDLQKLLNKRDNADAFPLSPGAKSYLLGLYSILRYGSRYKLKTAGVGVLQMMKGIATEPDCIKLLSTLDGCPYYKDKKKIQNNYLTGSIDIMDAPTIELSSKILDIKSCYQVEDIMNMVGKPLNKSNWWEMQGYLAIADKDEGEIHYCLVSFPESTIQQQKELFFEDAHDNGKAEARWDKIEQQLRFQDIIPEQRIVSYKVYRDEEAIQKVYEKVDHCRKWLSYFESEHNNCIKNRFTTNIQ